MQNSLTTVGQPHTNNMPSIAVLGMGGTIAASGKSAVATTEYSLSHGIDAVMEAVPEIHAFARISSEQFANVSSQEMSNVMLLALAKRVNCLLSTAAVDGIVITHGTDTLEETAYFLNLVVCSDKPVVMVGAMRPSTAMSADGPLNLLGAVRVAASPQAYAKGVLIVLNGRIGTARHTQKCHTSATDAFCLDETGVIGSVGDTVDFHAFSTKVHTRASDLDISSLEVLPMVDIIYGYQGAGLHLFEASIASGAKGIVFAATGNGTLSEIAKTACKLAHAAGVAFVRSSRVGRGEVSSKHNDVEFNAVSANSLNPQKARLLLSLALTHTTDRSKLQDYFNRY
jgi:L-asparaginase